MPEGDFQKIQTFRDVTSIRCDLTDKVCLLNEPHTIKVPKIDSLITHFKRRGRVDADKAEVNVSTTIPMTCYVMLGPPVSGRRETTLLCEH